jgi:hypothetical protein
MSELKIEHYVARIKTIEAIMVTLCASLPREVATTALALLDRAEAAIPPSELVSQEEYAQLLGKQFSPFRDALVASVISK